MPEDNDYRSRLRARVQQITSIEGLTLEEVKSQITTPDREGVDPDAPTGPTSEASQLEAIIRWYRPVLWINRDVIDHSFSVGARNHGVNDEILEEMKQHEAKIEEIIPSIGRIELVNNSHYSWAGTGWIIDADGQSGIVVTNAHVANIFGQTGQQGFIFRPGIPEFRSRQSARVDFREEIERTTPREFQITDVLWIAPNAVPDVAFLRVARVAGRDNLAPPVKLSPRADDGSLLAVIGYPGNDDRVEYADKLNDVFGSSFGIKRLSLGYCTSTDDEVLTHDCSTLPGSSGSIVWDVAGRAAVGLHFAGTAFSNNFAVPSKLLIDLLSQRPWEKLSLPRQQSHSPPKVPVDTYPQDSAGLRPSPSGDGTVSFTIPLHVSLRLGEPPRVPVPHQAATDSLVNVVKTDRSSAELVAEKIEEIARNSPEADSVLQVTTDYLFEDGVVSDKFGVIVAVAPSAQLNPSAYGLTDHVDGVTVVVEIADPQVIAEEYFGFEIETEAFKKRRSGYRRDLDDPKFSLDQVTDKIKMRLHVSPEAGWPVLREFLSTDKYEQLTIGMYHVTAPHIVEALLDVAKRTRPTPRITLTLDRQRGDKADNPDDISDGTKSNDIPERETIEKLKDILDTRFSYAKASIRSGGLFATAYHIKVAVWTDRLRGGRLSDKKFWLSSGNWQSSNQQPLEIDPQDANSLSFSDVKGYNREWHVEAEHAKLAKTFREHLQQDQIENGIASELVANRERLDDEIFVPIESLERTRTPTQFEAFAPLEIDETMTVHPLLTPDNFPEVVLDLIREARTRLWIQNQSFNLWKTVNETPKHFLDIAKAIRKKQSEEGVDVRILFRNIFGSERKTVRRLKAFGIRTDQSHLRYFETNHTKGIIVDDHSILLGSHNFTAGGTGPNRDASLIIRNKTANDYFARIFQHDWIQYGKYRSVPESESVRPVLLARGGVQTEAPQGYVAMSLGEFLGEG